LEKSAHPKIVVCESRCGLLAGTGGDLAGGLRPGHALVPPLFDELEGAAGELPVDDRDELALAMVAEQMSAKLPVIATM